MKVVILQSNYVPWKGYFDLIQEADVFVFYDCVKYTKNDWRNRNIIYTKNGKQWLTIPIESAATNQMIQDVEIKNKNWQKLHFKTLFFGYKKAPYFYQLEELIIDYLQDKEWNSLSELNQYLLQKISEKIGIKTQFRNANEFDMTGDRVERLFSILEKLNATEYISGQAAKSYLDGQEHLFEEKKILLSFKNYPSYPVYTQLSEPFEHGVSILDLIANIEWKEIKNYIFKV